MAAGEGELRCFIVVYDLRHDTVDIAENWSKKASVRLPIPVQTDSHVLGHSFIAGCVRARAFCGWEYRRKKAQPTEGRFVRVDALVSQTLTQDSVRVGNKHKLCPTVVSNTFTQHA